MPEIHETPITPHGRPAAAYALLARTLLEFTGPDRATFLHNLTTNQVKALTPGSGCELFFPSLQGKVAAHGYLFCEAEALVFDGVAGQAPQLLKQLDKYRIREKVQFHDHSADWADVVLTGVQAAPLLERLSGSPAPPVLYGSAALVLAGAPARVRRVDFLGAETYFVCVAAGAVPALTALLESAGAEAYTPAALETARLEAGFPEFGRDISPDHLCQEVNRTARAISFTKGCYLGQETIARIDALGHVNKLLVGLTGSGSAAPPAGTELLVDGKVVGHVTSAALSARLGAPLALGYVRTANAAVGSQLASSLGTLTVTPLPLV